MSDLIVGNKLSVNQQSSDTSAGWSRNGTNTVDPPAWDQVVYLDAPGSVKLTAIAIGSIGMQTGFTNGPLIEAESYFEFYTHIRAGGAWGATCILNYINSSNVQIGQSTSNVLQADGTVAGTGGTFTKMRTDPTKPRISPTGTVRCQVIVTVTGMEANETVNIDRSYLGLVPVGIPVEVWLAGQKKNATMRYVGL